MRFQPRLINRRAVAIGASVVVVAMLFIGYWGSTTGQRVGAEATEQTPQQAWGTLQVRSMTKLDLDTVSQLRHYLVSAVITNTTDDPIQFSPGMQAFIVDASGQRSAVTTRFLAPETIIGGEIAAHASWQGELDFEIAENTVPTRLVIEADAASAKLEGAL